MNPSLCPLPVFVGFLYPLCLRHRSRPPQGTLLQTKGGVSRWYVHVLWMFTTLLVLGASWFEVDVFIPVLPSFLFLSLSSPVVCFLTACVVHYSTYNVWPTDMRIWKIRLFCPYKPAPVNIDDSAIFTGATPPLTCHVHLIFGVFLCHSQAWKTYYSVYGRFIWRKKN